MPITLASVVIDTADVEQESAFWSRLLDGSATVTPTHHFVQAPGLPVIVVQSAPGHVAPGWPDGAPQQMHLDFGVEDLVAADRTATEAGAVPLETRTGSRTYASPAGHPFCLRAT